MKFIAVQTGARRGYAVPSILERAGLLERFYTDLAGNVGAGRAFASLATLPIIGPHLDRLANRQIPDLIIARTLAFHLPALGLICGNSFGERSAESRFRRQVAFSNRWAAEMTRVGFGKATHVYSMLSEGGNFLAEAHQRGLSVVAEIYILLSTERLMDIERRAFPDWEPDSPNYSELRRRFVKKDVLFECCHYYVCPSEAVKEDLVINWNVPVERIALVPYGMNPHWLELEQKPQPGRVLFAGTAELRKGIHYLAMAAEQLRARGRNYEFRVAGNVSDQVRQQPVCRHLNFLGRVPRDRIHEEFQRADVFVLPSLAEGSAEVTYEALAAGVPLVVTKAAGSVAREGIEGRIVPERDSAALADAIENVIEKRELRSKMALAARERAREFTWEKYGDRLVAALSCMEQ